MWTQIPFIHSGNKRFIIEGMIFESIKNKINANQIFLNNQFIIHKYFYIMFI